MSPTEFFKETYGYITIRMTVGNFFLLINSAVVLQFNFLTENLNLRPLIWFFCFSCLLPQTTDHNPSFCLDVIGVDMDTTSLDFRLINSDTATKTPSWLFMPRIPWWTLLQESINEMWWVWHLPWLHVYHLRNYIRIGFPPQDLIS